MRCIHIYRGTPQLGGIKLHTHFLWFHTAKWGVYRIAPRTVLYTLYASFWPYFRGAVGSECLPDSPACVRINTSWPPRLTWFTNAPHKVTQHTCRVTHESYASTLAYSHKNVTCHCNGYVFYNNQILTIASPIHVKIMACVNMAWTRSFVPVPWDSLVITVRLISLVICCLQFLF